MHYVPFQDHFPELAKKETRVITIGSGYTGKLPYDSYALMELYCIDPKCDCRRVMFSVASAQTMNNVAVVNFGWESRKFYEKWLGTNAVTTIDELKGPSLNTASYQFPYAYELLNFIRDVVLKDKDYVNRLKRHYDLFKQKIKSEGTSIEQNLNEFKVFEKIGRNDPCSCGSGLKHKKCCAK